MAIRFSALFITILELSAFATFDPVFYPHCLTAFEAVRSRSLRPIPHEYSDYRRRVLDENPDLLRLMTGIPVFLRNSRREKLKLTLKAFWYRDLKTFDSNVDLAGFVQRFRVFVANSYDNDKRLALNEGVKSRVEWEDISFFWHQGWVYLENDRGDIVFAVRLYYFDYRFDYSVHQHIEIPTQMYLPLERKHHILNLASSAFESDFVEPFWLLPEHYQLKNRLGSLTGNEVRHLVRNAATPNFPEDYFLLSTRKLRLEQITAALAIHQNYQLGEIGRYIRARSDETIGVEGMSVLSYGGSVLMKSEGISSLRLEADTLPHVKLYSPHFAPLATILQKDMKSEITIFEVSQESLIKLTDPSLLKGR